MEIIIDYRETQLYKLLQEELNDDIISLKKDNLSIGDIVIKNSDNNKTLFIIERKTISDLVSSISDGRYKEQCFRLSDTEHDNHNIIYVIEGNIKQHNFNFTRIKSDTVYAVMCSLQFLKGFSLFKSDSIHETKTYIINLAKKMIKSLGVQTTSDYISVMQKSNKKKYIDKDNITSILLSQIPGISNITAKAIVEKYSSISTLIYALKDNEECLNDIKCGSANKRISKAVIQKLKDYL